MQLSHASNSDLSDGVWGLPLGIVTIAACALTGNIMIGSIIQAFIIGATGAIGGYIGGRIAKKTMDFIIKKFKK